MFGDDNGGSELPRKAKKSRIPKADRVRVRSRFGNQSRDEIAAVLRGRLISKIDLLFAKKEGVLAAVLEVCDAADALAAAIQDGDGDGVKVAAARFRVLRMEIPGASRGMSAITLFQAVMQGLFPEEFAEDEPDEVARDLHKQYRAAKEAAPDSEKRLKKRLGKLARIMTKKPNWYDLHEKDKSGVMPAFGGHYADAQLEVMMATV